MNWRLMHTFFNSVYKCVTSRIPCLSSFIVITCMLGCLFLSSCQKAKRSPTDGGRAKPVLSASPNPVPAGDIEEPLGSTTITWNTGDGAPGDLYVKVDREPEKFMARAPSGTREIRWIQFDSVYEFRLYDKKRSKLLAKLEVTRDD
jgi:hypothetical protein